MTLTQNQRIIEYMRKKGSITQLEVLNKLGCMRLASRISDLKRSGYKITGSMETVKNRYGEKCTVKRYSLIEDNGEGALDNGSNTSK